MTEVASAILLTLFCAISLCLSVITLAVVTSGGRGRRH